MAKNKSKQDGDINSAIFFKNALDEINFLEKGTDVYQKHQHKILKEYKSHINTINNKQQKSSIIITLNKMKDRLKQQDKLQQNNNREISKLQSKLSQAQESIMKKIEGVQKGNLDISNAVLSNNIKNSLTQIQENLQEELKNHMKEIQLNIDKIQDAPNKNEQGLTKFFRLLIHKVKILINQCRNY